jgi:hypothetical protein
VVLITDEAIKGAPMHARCDDYRSIFNDANINRYTSGIVKTAYQSVKCTTKHGNDPHSSCLEPQKHSMAAFTHQKHGTLIN